MTVRWGNTKGIFYLRSYTGSINHIDEQEEMGTMEEKFMRILCILIVAWSR